LGQRRFTRDDFDRSGVVVEWLDARRSGQLNALLNLYEERATLICDCDGINLAGRNSIAEIQARKQGSIRLHAGWHDPDWRRNSS
jgi:hypothetical protein